MTYRMATVGAIAVLAISLCGMAWAQNGQNDESRPSLRQQPGQTAKDDQKPPAPSPEDDAYQAILSVQNDPANVIPLGEAFTTKYPASMHLLAVYSILTPAYLETNQFDKMNDAGAKALQLDADDVDVLPILAFAVPRRANAKMPEGLEQLQKAQTWARHGIELLDAMTKPDGADDAAFQAAKNEKLSMCHDGLGVVDLKTGKFDDAITELKQSMQLGSEPDPVDYLLLGIAQESTNHFDEAVASFTKCAAAGPVQTQCKAGIDETKKKATKDADALK
jgi:tetratricopeptide (TPR) repeat protein